MSARPDPGGRARRRPPVAGLAALALLLLPGVAAPAGSAEAARARYRAAYAGRVVPLLSEAIAFATVAGNAEASARQKAWLARNAAALGLSFRDAGKVAEVDLPGPAGAPVLGLVVHGDVQPADAAEWRHPPFQATAEGGALLGRGAADDKGPLVQALLALAALRDAGPARSHTVRLLVGSDEESENRDFLEYLASSPAPALSLVLDSLFPVVVGEKGWNALEVVAPDPYAARPGPPSASLRIVSLEAGLAASIVPATARARLLPAGDPDGAARALRGQPVPDGYRLEVGREGEAVVVVARGRAAHSGMDLEGGRNALVLLARALAGRVAPSGAADLLALAARAGGDLHGAGLGLAAASPEWRWDVNVATLKPDPSGRLVLTVNIRGGPGLVGDALARHLARQVGDFAERTGARLEVGPGYFADAPLAFDPESRIVRRLLAAYRRGAGRDDPPSVSPGGTYAKRIPRAIAFGMWFPDRTYPGHAADESVPIADLHRGVDVLLEALVDLACSPPIPDPFAR